MIAVASSVVFDIDWGLTFASSSLSTTIIDSTSVLFFGGQMLSDFAKFKSPFTRSPIR